MTIIFSLSKEHRDESFIKVKNSFKMKGKLCFSGHFNYERKPGA